MPYLHKLHEFDFRLIPINKVDSSGAGKLGGDTTWSKGNRGSDGEKELPICEGFRYKVAEEKPLRPPTIEHEVLAIASCKGETLPLNNRTHTLFLSPPPYSTRWCHRG